MIGLPRTLTRPRSLQENGSRRAVRWSSSLSFLLIPVFFLTVRSLRLHQILQEESVSVIDQYYDYAPIPRADELHRRQNEMRPSRPGPRLQEGSALVSLASIPEKERQFNPGVYNYGLNDNALIVTGASITSEYHSSNKLWLQLFALGDKVFSNEKCDFIDDRSNGNDTTVVLKPWEEMKDERFLCKVGATTARFTLMPSNGYDPNTNEVLQIWRCPIILSSFDYEQFREHPTDGMALAVDVMHESSQNNDVNEVMKLHLPSIDPNVGVNRIMSHSPIPVLHQRHNITLCVVAHANGLANLNEFIRYHHDIIGIDHFHIGIHMQHGGDENAAVPQIANRLLKTDIDEGRVSVSALWDKKSVGVDCGMLQHYPKMFFYQQCLYRAKSTSEFVATWDLDEYILFKDDISNKVKRTQQYLPSFLRGVQHPKCQDWSFVTMESSLAGWNSSNDDRTGIAALDYPLREAQTEKQWQKSISRTKNVFQNSFHVPGACLPQGKFNVTDAIAMDPNDGECAFYVDDALMVHTRGIQNRARSHTLNGATVPNELRYLFANGQR